MRVGQSGMSGLGSGLGFYKLNNTVKYKNCDRAIVYMKVGQNGFVRVKVGVNNTVMHGNFDRPNVYIKGCVCGIIGAGFYLMKCHLAVT